jgi:hypothetical protein
MDNDRQRDGKQVPQATTHAEVLDEAQLEQARGGASDYLLTLDGIKGESSDRSSRAIKIDPLTIKQK